MFIVSKQKNFLCKIGQARLKHKFLDNLCNQNILLIKIEVINSYNANTSNFDLLSRS